MVAMETNCNKILAYNLKRLRRVRELTQETVAHDTGIGCRTYNDLEAGKGNPTLQTIDLLAQFFGVVVSHLLNLNFIKLSESESEFRSKVEAKFIDEDLGFLIRDFNGVALWGNKVISKVANFDVTKQKLDLLSIKSDTAQTILKAQLQAEQLGYVQPYLNFTKGPNDEMVYFRIYPTLVYPQQGSKALYSATYMTPMAQDTESRYYRYCSLLLDCV